MGDDGQFEGVIWEACEIAPGALPGDLMTARAIFENACQPAEGRKLEHALAELSLICKSRAEDSRDVAARIAIFVDKLKSYPGDVALEAIRQWGHSEKWFPSWTELRIRCDLLGSKRMAVHKAILKEAAPPQAFELEPLGDRLAAIYSSYLKHFGANDPRTVAAKQRLNEYSGA